LAEPISQGTFCGDILIRSDALLPRSLHLASQAFTAGWRRVASAGHLESERCELDRQIKAAGWTFFYLAGEIKATALGHDEKAVRRAINRILTAPESEQFNAMEIITWKTIRILGLPFVTVTAHARQIQEGATLLQPRWTGRAKPHSSPELSSTDYKRGNHVVHQW
jgi:hypothetical protein